tara:strand:- start:428 stop:823 length:396 start_codon:yes stop_codon:yes gene_type:complete
MMPYKKIDQLLLHSSFQVVTELGAFKQTKNSLLDGFLYTLYRNIDNNLLIGFTSEIGELVRISEGLGYELIDNKIGNQNELKILKETLLELGYRENNKNGYTYSYKLVKYLNLLDWPIGSMIKKRKIIKHF